MWDTARRRKSLAGVSVSTVFISLEEQQHARDPKFIAASTKRKSNSKHVSTSTNGAGAVCARRETPDEEQNRSGIEMEM